LTEIDIRHIGNAIGAFEGKAFSARRAAYDDYLKGDEDALSESAKRGLALSKARPTDLPPKNWSS
jgi:cytochrome c peroxidase